MTAEGLIDFHHPCDADREILKAAAFAGDARSAEYSFSNVMTWADAYEETVAVVQGRFVIRSGTLGGCYSWGVGDKSHLDDFVAALARDAAQRNVPLAFWGLDQDDRAWLEAHAPNGFAFQPCEGYWDYCYAIENLANLPGGKFQKKRNHVHAFESAFPDWRVEPLDAKHVEACLEVASAWDAEDAAEGTRDVNSTNGERALRQALAHVEGWGLDGLVLFASDKPVAFSLGERLSTRFYDVLFEKAPRDLRGAYPMINREFARFIMQRYPEVRYLNREDTMGEDHLKKAKESYHPDLMIQKQSAVMVVA